jgi:hypothetical protein
LTAKSIISHSGRNPTVDDDLTSMYPVKWGGGRVETGSSQ